MSRLVVHKDIVYASGQVAPDAGDAAAQTAAILEKIDSILAEAGTDKSRLLSCNIWLRDIAADFAAMNEVWCEWVDPDNKPARATVQAEMARPSILVEIQVIADKHGNEYRPKDEDTGSMCATSGFPHAVAYTKEKGRGKSQATMEYIVAACNKVKLTVRLKKYDKHNNVVPASEAELIHMIASQRSVSQMQGNLDYEQDMVLYVALEFADGDDNFARVMQETYA